jgi:hypothetical protein
MYNCAFKTRYNCLYIYRRVAEIPGKFWNVVLENDGEDKLDGPRK